MILIVDDKAENIFSLKKLLEVNTFDVDTALSGEEALKKVRDLGKNEPLGDSVYQMEIALFPLTRLNRTTRRSNPA